MIPVCIPTLGKKELEYVQDCVKTNWISSQGGYIKKFEEGFSSYCGAKYGISCTSGTTALHLALESLGIGFGDEAIIPNFTMIATSYAVIYTGARPVLVDSEPYTWNIDTEKIEEKISKRTRAIMPVHIYGHPCDMDKINKLARDYNLYVIEDAAEAHGAEYKEKKVGNLSDIGCFSFYANKIITTGEGGMLVTNDEKIAKRAKVLREHGFGEPRFVHSVIGFNYLMTNMQAAIGLAQLENIENLVQARINNANLYNKYLSKIEGIKTPPKSDWAKNVYWMYGILIDNKFGVKKEDIMKKLYEKGVDTRNFFVPMHKQPIYQNKDPRFPDTRGNYPVSDELSSKGFYLPSSSSLKKEEIKYIVDCIKEIKETGQKQ